MLQFISVRPRRRDGIVIFPFAFLGLNAVLYPLLNGPPSRAQLQLFPQFARIATSLHRQAPRAARGSRDHRGQSKRPADEDTDHECGLRLPLPSFVTWSESNKTKSQELAFLVYLRGC